MRDAKLCDLMINKTHDPVKPGSKDGRWKMLTLLDQKSREGKVTLIAKNQEECAAIVIGWLACLLIHKLNNGEYDKMTFHHDGTNKTPD